MNDAAIIGAIITATVTIIVGAFALVKQAMRQTSRDIKDFHVPSPDCLNRVIHFMESTEKVLVEASRIQHTQVRYMDDLRQEISHLRTELGEIKGMLR